MLIPSDWCLEGSGMTTADTPPGVDDISFVPLLASAGPKRRGEALASPGQLTGLPGPINPCVSATLALSTCMRPTRFHD